LLESSKGVSLIARSARGNEITLYGVSSERLDITVDGMRLAEACTDKMDPVNGNINSFILKGIDVNANSTGPSTGNSGNVNLSLIRPQLSGPYQKTRISQNFESASLARSSNISFEKGNGRKAHMAAAGYTQADNYRMGNGEKLPFSQYNMAYAYWSGTECLKNKAQIDGRFLWNKGWDMGFPALPMDVSKAEMVLAGLDYSQRDIHSKWLQTKLKLYGSYVTHIMDDTKRPDVPMHMDMPGLSSSIGFVWQNKFLSFGKKVRANFSVNRIFQYADMTMYGNENDEMFMLTWPGVENLGASLDFEWSLFKNEKSSSKLKTSLFSNRLKATDEMGRKQWTVFVDESALTRLSIRPAIKWNLKRRFKNAWSLNSKVELTTRNPGTSELFGYYLYNRNDGYDYIGNPDLLNESRIHVSACLSKKIGMLRVEAILHSNMYENYIQGIAIDNYLPMTPGSFGVRQFVNIDHAWITGFETNIKLLTTSGFKLEQSSQYLRGMLLSEQDNLPQIAPFTSRTSIFYRWNNSQFSFSHEFYSKQRKTNANLNEGSTPGYNLANLNYSWTKDLAKDRKFKLDLSCRNVFNAFYHSHMSWNNIPSAGRNIVLNLGVVL